MGRRRPQTEARVLGLGGKHRSPSASYQSRPGGDHDAEWAEEQCDESFERLPVSSDAV